MLETIPAPLDGWLVFMASGWQLPNPLDTPHAYQGNDGAYSVRLWRGVRRKRK